jgi:hypothetical protein
MESQMRPLVSVLVPTYQHAAYIAACLDGILAQRSDFALEILVGEDESTDGTRAICQRYAERHPDRIRLFLRERKDVMHIGDEHFCLGMNAKMSELHPYRPLQDLNALILLNTTDDGNHRECEERVE